MPDIITQALPVILFDGQTLIFDFILNGIHRFNPGDAPSSCPSVDDITWLPTRSENVFQVDFPFKVELAADNKLRALVKFSRLGEKIVFAFRLKYREGPGPQRVPRKVVLLATVNSPNPNVILTKG